MVQANKWLRMGAGVPWLFTIRNRLRHMKCTDKIAYNTRREAYEASRHVRRRGKRLSMYIYECKYCGSFHLTHIRPSRFDARLALAHKYNFNDVSEQ